MKRRSIVVLSALVAVTVLIAVGCSLFVPAGKRSFTNIPEDGISQDAPAQVPENGPSVPVVVAEPVGPTDIHPTTTDIPITAHVSGGPTASDTKEVTGPPVVERLVSFGHENRTSRDIDTVVVHSSYDALGSDPYSVSGVIAEYEQSGVSPHYLIDRKGVIYRLVEDRDVAYHAGVSKLSDGRTGVNEFSVGIEVLEKDTDSPTDVQYSSLNALVASLRKRYTSIRNVVGHSDIAPVRKTDPWNFDWKRMK
ncbi:MAG: hypothetical protein HGA31_03890 [Candidatus Moranbacteria bacterium]|nr:hypothetical protein [Candidatus Moranbacteria bacterium]